VRVGEKILFLKMTATAWVYILTNKGRTTLYVGVTTDLRSRLWEHQTKQSEKSFASRYNLTVLIYYEGYETITDAIVREKYIKGKSRKWKEDLINSKNATWKDLSSHVDSLV
jgi:putative endonuclease